MAVCAASVEEAADRNTLREHTRTTSTVRARTGIQLANGVTKDRFQIGGPGSGDITAVTGGWHTGCGHSGQLTHRTGRVGGEQGSTGTATDR